MDQQCKHLFSPGRIGNTELRNRIVFSAHSPGYWGMHEGPNQRTIDYYLARVKGGVGMVVLAQNFPAPPTSEDAAIALRDEKTVSGYKAFSNAMHEAGAKVVGQLEHPGLRGNVSLYGGVAFSSSSTPWPDDFMPSDFEVPYEMEIEDIRQIVEDYGDAALKMEEMGYDGVEISSTVGAGGLLVSFLSPYYNKRRDEYGGSLENRMRLLVEILDAVRSRVGKDFIVGVRLVSDELLDGGITLDDARRIAPELAATGQVDYLSVCPGVAGHIPSMYYPLGCFVHLAVGIKEVVTLPVICHGRVNDPVQAEQILANNQADFVGMARALICDPEWPNKARAGKIDEIRKCIACNQACIGYYCKGLPISCSLNPEVGKEKELAVTPAEKSRKVVVVGGGAAGLETARVAALRGHKVTLFEKADELGGQLNIAARIPGRLDFGEAPRYYSRQLEMLGVQVELGTEATVRMIQNEAPDAVVVATGSTQVMPEIPGGDGSNVMGVRDVLKGDAGVGRNVVVIADEHHEQALGVADFLVDQGKTVQVLCPTLYAGGQLDPTTLPVIYSRLLRKGVLITPLTKVKEIRQDMVVTVNVMTGEENRIKPVDTVVYAANGKADDSLCSALVEAGLEIHRVGHCFSPRKLQHSVWDGARVGRLL